MGKRGNGEGSITRRKDGTYMAHYWVETPAGKKGEKRQDVADKLAEALGDRSKGLVFEADNLKVGEYLDLWIADSVKDAVKATTFERYEQIVRLHIEPVLGRRSSRP